VMRGVLEALAADLKIRGVLVHMGEAILDGKKPEALKAETLKVEAIRTNGESTVPGGKFLP
jgi:hypothetical protein